MPDRLERAVQLQSVLRAWLAGRRETTIGAYWPIKGEFDPLPALYRWSEGDVDGAPRRIGLPVADRAERFAALSCLVPGLPDGARRLRHSRSPRTPTSSIRRCSWCRASASGPAGCAWATAAASSRAPSARSHPRPLMVGVSYTHGFLPMLRLAPGDLQLDAILTEDGVMWQGPAV